MIILGKRQKMVKAKFSNGVDSDPLVPIISLLFLENAKTSQKFLEVGAGGIQHPIL